MPYHEAVHVVRDRGLLDKKSELGSRFSSPSQTLGMTELWPRVDCNIMTDLEQGS